MGRWCAAAGPCQPHPGTTRPYRPGPKRRSCLPGPSSMPHPPGSRRRSCLPGPSSTPRKALLQHHCPPAHVTTRIGVGHPSFLHACIPDLPASLALPRCCSLAAAAAAAAAGASLPPRCCCLAAAAAAGASLPPRCCCLAAAASLLLLLPRCCCCCCLAAAGAAGLGELAQKLVSRSLLGRHPRSTSWQELFYTGAAPNPASKIRWVAGWLGGWLGGWGGSCEC